MTFWRRTRAQHDRELEDEICSHLEMAAERRRELGAPDPAGEARREFGNIARVKESTLEVWGGRWLEDFLADARHGLRLLRKSPGFAAAAVLTLALGIGANTAVFSLAKAVLLDGMPVPHADELRLLTWNQNDRSAIGGTLGDFYDDGNGGIVTASFSYPVYRILRQNRSLGDLFAFNVEGGGFDRASATIDGHAEIVIPELVSGNYFQALGVGVQAGRPIEPADDRAPGSGAVAVISDSFWMRRFGRSPAAIGKLVELNLVPVEIVGVAPHGFGGASHTQVSSDVFLPLSMQPVIFPRRRTLLTDPQAWWVQIMGRVPPGVRQKEAAAALAVTLSQGVRATVPVPPNRTLPALRLLAGNRGGLNYVANDLQRPLAILLGLAGLVLLLACVNIMNLLLVRSAARGRELSLRLALGAGRSRIVRQMLTEGLVIASLGGAAGLAAGYMGRNVLSRLLSAQWGPAQFGARFDWHVFAFALAMAAATGIAFGLMTAWHVMRMGIHGALKESGASVTRGRREGSVARVLVAAQVALGVVLLVSAGLFLRTLGNLHSVNPGFRAQGLLLFGITPPEQRYPSPKNVEVLHSLEEKIAALPGVEAATLSQEALLAGSSAGNPFIPDGPSRQPTSEQNAQTNRVGQRFLETMDIPVIAGRTFDRRDTETSPRVAVINQALARKFFAGLNPVGQTFRTGENRNIRFEIIGVSRDAHYAGLRGDPPPTFYTLYLQEPDETAGVTFEVRTRGDRGATLRAIRQAVESVDKDLPLIDVRTQTQQIEATIGQERILATVTSGFGLLALVLATVGIYGVMAYTVERRVKEIGVMMALGAARRDVLRLVLSQAMRLTLVGIGLGVAAAFALSKLIRTMLYGIEAADPATYAAVALVLAAVSVAACYIPARRATAIDPMVALRHE